MAKKRTPDPAAAPESEPAPVPGTRRQEEDGRITIVPDPAAPAEPEE